MADSGVGAIYIRRRIVQIGHQFLPLANISRVQTLRDEVKLGFSVLHGISMIVLVVAVLVGLGNLARDSGPAVTVVASGLFLVVVIHGASRKRARYTLLVETSGSQVTVLMSTSAEDLRRLRNAILDAIEDPPVGVVAVPAGDTYIDARGAKGVLVGDSGTQSNSFGG